jgi:DNA-binding beta-propeller fold protein YncE
MQRVNMNRASNIFTTTFLILLLFSCSGSKEITEPKELIIYPAPPEKPRIQYLTSISKSTDITGEQSDFMASVIGEEEVRSLNKPYGISIHKGKIYVCDTMLGGLIIIDLNNSTFENFIPKGLGQLKKPINCFIDSEGKLYVTDSQREQVIVFDAGGNYITSFGEKQEAKPIDVFVDESNIWVADLKNHKVNIYDKTTFDYQFSIPKDNADSLATLYSPTNLYVRNKKLYVSDFGGFNIKVYTREGEYLQTIGSYGRNLGQFVRQKGIAVDKEENLYVVDAGFENVQIFNKEGQLLMFFGGPYKGPGDMYLPAKVIVDYDNSKYFQQYVHDGFDLKYLIFVTNQYGPDKINVYGFITEK